MNDRPQSRASATAEAEGPLLLTHMGGRATITLNRPARGNAVDLELARALKHAMHRCEAEPGLRAIVIRGAGRMFCAGGDLAAIAAAGADAPDYVGELLTHLHEALLSIFRIPVPVVAAVRTAAAGAGLALACACDLTIATESSRFVMSYSSLGLSPDGSSSWVIPRLIGLKRTMQLALTNRELSAREACDWGLITETVADDAFEAHLQGLLERLESGATAALGEAKRLINLSFEHPLEAQLEREADAIRGLLRSENASEGLRAFLSKRKPIFRA